MVWPSAAFPPPVRMIIRMIHMRLFNTSSGLTNDFPHEFSSDYYWGGSKYEVITYTFWMWSATAEFASLCRFPSSPTGDKRNVGNVVRAVALSTFSLAAGVIRFEKGLLFRLKKCGELSATREAFWLVAKCSHPDILSKTHRGSNNIIARDLLTRTVYTVNYYILGI